MTEWYDSLAGIEQFLFLTGVFSTLIFAIQFLMTLTGLGGDDADMDGDISDNDGLSLGDVYTLRNGVSFLMGFSWGGLMAFDWGLENAFFVGVIGFIIGLVLVAINMLLLFGMAQLKHDGSIRLENAIGERATVTLPVPAARSGVGKVMVPIQGRLKEYHAVTEGEAFGRHDSVSVIDVEGSQLVVADRLDRD
jgi:membrane protein implicated in regulation of membrane protease activity